MNINLETWTLVILVIAAAITVGAITAIHFNLRKGKTNGTQTHFVDSTDEVFSRDGSCNKCEIRPNEEA